MHRTLASLALCLNVLSTAAAPIGAGMGAGMYDVSISERANSGRTGVVADVWGTGTGTDAAVIGVQPDDLDVEFEAEERRSVDAEPARDIDPYSVSKRSLRDSDAIVIGSRGDEVERHDVSRIVDAYSISDDYDNNDLSTSGVVSGGIGGRGSGRSR
ncbi:hypothetical protein C8J57DRAFT_1230063 [Mycena rebaudengoi]|nr:hypothetical protein C8J57DRAFT_1230063 [Mycena rebaudengoi]